MAKKSKVKLKAGASIGHPAAEEDTRYLRECFVNNPIVDAIKDVASRQSILLGRTGSGKSAILWHLEDTLPNVTRINPKDIAFDYIGNSSIIRHLNDLGVDLHLLYEYLWTHVITLHFIRECLRVKSKDGMGSIVRSIKELVWRDEKRALAAEYLEKHADQFWITVEQVSAEFTDKISERLAAEVGLSATAFKANIERGDEWQEAEKRLFKYRAQETVSKLQMRDLKEVISALSSQVNQAESYYILIDDLDVAWAGDDRTQYALIRALIESLKTFRRITNLKIVVALREDLYEAMLRTTTDKHFQAEKLDGVVRRLRWTDSALITLIERRIHELFKYEYTKQTVKLADVLPEMVTQTAIREYLLERTLRRPRDVIAFVNKILADAEGENLPVSARNVTKAEPGYSSDRLRALEDEWRSCHPMVRQYIKAVHGLSGANKLDVLDEDRLFDLVYEASELDRRPVDDVERIAKAVYDRDKELRFRRLGRALLAVLFKFGVIGVKLQPSQPYSYCYENRASLDDTEITANARFIAHPMVLSALGCHPVKANAA